MDLKNYMDSILSEDAALEIALKEFKVSHRQMAPLIGINRQHLTVLFKYDVSEHTKQQLLKLIEACSRQLHGDTFTDKIVADREARGNADNLMLNYKKRTKKCL